MDFTPRQIKLLNQLKNPLKFRLFTLLQVPAARIAGLQMEKIDGKECTTSIPFKFLNKNPFKSIYFAVQSMAAEFSTAALALLELKRYQESVAFIVVNIEGEFSKKATGKTFFTCEMGEEFKSAIQKTIETGEAVTVRAKTIGKMKDGTEVSTFYFTWSFKKRDK